MSTVPLGPTLDVFYFLGVCVEKREMVPQPRWSASQSLVGRTLIASINFVIRQPLGSLILRLVLDAGEMISF